jgi:triphosphoribosyl-dephospho-CoA synthase
MCDRQFTIGSLAQIACAWEVRARKAGNVCPGREFPDLTVNDFLQSAAAIAPVLEQAARQPLGITILHCIEETRKVVATNTNLGIVLLLAPLASVPLDQPLLEGVSDVLARTTVEDSRRAFAAIRLAKPGGLGEVQDQDVSSEPTLPLRDVMALARNRDAIADQYAGNFTWIGDMARVLANMAVETVIEHAVIEFQLVMLGMRSDSLIRRKLGAEEARRVSQSARAISLMGTRNPEGRHAYRDFDAFLRSDNHVRNPGTTADLITAALFVALREKWIDAKMPFDWQEHPFSEKMKDVG